MSVARMCRVEVVGYQPVLDDVLDALQRVGAVQVEAAPEDLGTAALHPDDERLRNLEEYAADARFVCDFLRRYHVPTQPFAAFVGEKFHIGVDDFAASTPATSCGTSTRSATTSPTASPRASARRRGSRRSSATWSRGATPTCRSRAGRAPSTSC